MTGQVVFRPTSNGGIFEVCDIMAVLTILDVWSHNTDSDSGTYSSIVQGNGLASKLVVMRAPKTQLLKFMSRQEWGYR